MAAVALFEEPLPSDDDIDNLLHSTAHSNAAITDSLLAQHTTADLGEFSAKLTALVSMSKGFDPHLVKPGLCEKALGFFRTEREQMLAHTQTVKQQVERTVKELEAKALQHRQRIDDIAGLQQDNLAVHQERKAASTKLQAWLALVEDRLKTPISAEDNNHLSRLRTRLESGIADAENAMLLAKQNALKLQMTADTSRGIIDQFHRVSDNVIPALKSVLEQQLLGMEQKAALTVNTLLSETLDSALRSGAQNVGENAISSAELQQKSVINFQTIADCQDILDGTASRVREIEEQGRLARLDDAAKRVTLAHDIFASITR